MKHLFINSFIAKDYATLYSKLELVLIMWLVVLVAIIIDLIAGLRKATELNELHTSEGFRRTVTKATQYYALMCFALMFDILSSLVSPMPYFSMLASFFLVYVEGKSVFEKAQEKDRRKANKHIKDLITLIEHKDYLLKGVAEVLKESETKEQEDEK